MSDRIIIAAEPRTINTKTARQLRQDGLVPGVVYGQTETVHVQMEAKALRKALRAVGTTNLTDLDIAGDHRTVLVREVQQHATRGELLHVDFFEVDLLKKLRAEAQLVPSGESRLERAGLGSVVFALRHVEIEATPESLVAQLEVDLSLIRKADDVIHVRDLKVPAGVTILAEGSEVVASFEYIRTAEQEATDEAYGVAADSVEVIGRGKKEDDFED